jgi:hypothetical protein
MEVISQPEVIGQVAGEEQHRSDKGQQHAETVGGHVLAANESEPHDQKYRAQAVEAGVDGGKDGENFVNGYCWRVEGYRVRATACALLR